MPIADEIAAGLEAQAAARGISVGELLAEVAPVVTVEDDPLEAFLGGGRGDGTAFEIHEASRELAGRRAAAGIENL